MEFYKKNLTPLKGVFGMIETGGGAASNNVISPAMFEEFCLPYDIRQHELIHEIDPNIAISYHTCGGMMKLLDLIPRNGCDFSETLSPPGCGGDIHDHRDEAEVKRILGSKVKLMGGLNQSEILEKGSKEQIYAEVERCFKGYGANGGYIMMPSDHFFHAPKVNLEHYARAVQEICKY
jgi:uroporphyrinogen-III decarboxylase